MSRKIKIFDTTLRDGEQSPGCSMHLSEKLELALQLERLGVDVIEAGFAIASPGDFKSVKAVAETIKDCQIASLCRALPGDIDASYEALRGAASPRLHIFLATSPIHLKYKLRMTQDEVLERIAAMVKYAKKLISNVEFSAEDASRTPLPYLLKAIQTAIDNGADTVNIPDTVGYSTPQEMFEIISYLKNNLVGVEKIDISCHNHNDLGCGVANSLACVLAGASQVECTINGIGERAGNASLEEVVMALNTRKDFYGVYTNINTKQIYRTSRMLSNIIGVQIPPTKPIVGANAFAHESGIHQHGVLAEKTTYEILSPEDVGVPENKIVLGKHSGKHAFAEHLKEMGYELSENELLDMFDKFKALCDKKKYVSRKDIEALLAHKEKVAGDGEYALNNFGVSRTTKGRSAATVELVHKELVHFATDEGDGPVDASFKAINKIIAKEISLTDFSVSSVTEGKDALGEAIVKIKYGENTATGRGISTDIIESSLLAYINAVNKLVMEE